MDPDQIKAQRKAIEIEAFTWLGTPFHHNAAIKGVGVDCAHVGESFRVALGIDIPYPEQYSAQWHLHAVEGPDGPEFKEIYLEGALAAGFLEIPQELIDVGDVVMSRIARTFCHAGIIVGWPYVIQAESCPMGANKVVRANAEANWYLSRRELKFLSRQEWHV